MLEISAKRCNNISAQVYKNHKNNFTILRLMETFYHGSSALFDRFDLSHVLEGDGKVKFGYGVYVTSHYRSAAHYARVNKEATTFYVYTVEVPDLKEDNHIAFKQAVHPSIISRAEEALGGAIPAKVTADGKDFRKHLAKRLTGKVDLAGEKAAAELLDSIGVDFIVWPYNWRNPALGTNRAVLNDSKVRIVKVDQIEKEE